MAAGISTHGGIEDANSRTNKQNPARFEGGYVRQLFVYGRRVPTHGQQIFSNNNLYPKYIKRATPCLQTYLFKTSFFLKKKNTDFEIALHMNWASPDLFGSFSRKPQKFNSSQFGWCELADQQTAMYFEKWKMQGWSESRYSWTHKS